MSISIADAVKLPSKDWRWIGERMIASIREHVANKMYFKGKAYSAGYRESKAAGKAADKGVPQSSTSTTPDLTLTGKMLKGVEVRQASGDGVTIGWIGNDAAKVDWNADMGRAITTSKVPLIPPVDKELDVDVNTKYAERVKLTGGTTNINLKM